MVIWLTIWYSFRFFGASLKAWFLVKVWRVRVDPKMAMFGLNVQMQQESCDLGGLVGRFEGIYNSKAPNNSRLFLWTMFLLSIYLNSSSFLGDFVFSCFSSQKKHLWCLGLVLLLYREVSKGKFAINLWGLLLVLMPSPFFDSRGKRLVCR